MKRALIFLFSLLCISCSTLLDVDVESISLSEENFEFEKRFAYADSEYISGNQNLKEFEQLASDIESHFSNPGMQKAALARLYALDGLVLLRQNKKVQAQKCLEMSEQFFKGDLFAVILAHRLNPSGVPLDKSSAGEKSMEKGRLVLEEALDLFADKKYLEAVAGFDSAFISLNPAYRDAYGEIRNLCWKLRSVSSENQPEDLLALKRISVMQMLLITRKTTELLYNYTGDKKVSEKELYAKIHDAGLLNPVSTASSPRLSITSDHIVTKYIAARFLWNLYNAKKNTSHLAARYSMKYQNSGRKSPVADVLLDNPDFDAVLGCVEREILNLEDGISFNGSRELSAIDFSESLRKIAK